MKTAREKATTSPGPRELTRAARTLRSSLRRCGRLNRAKDMPIPEQNLVLHLGAALLRGGYSIYGEADLPGAGRIDLLACDDQEGLIVEASAFGAINTSKLLGDALRLEKFKPQGPWKLLSKRPTQAFWKELDQRWGMLAVLCFSSPHLARCWRSMGDAGALEAALDAPAAREIRAFGPDRREALRELAKFLRRRGAGIGVIPVLPAAGVWRGVMPLWLLWSTWRLR